MDDSDLHVAELEMLKDEISAAEQAEADDSRMNEVSGDALDTKILDAPGYKFGEVNNWRYGIAMKQLELGVKDTWLY